VAHAVADSAARGPVLPRSFPAEELTVRTGISKIAGTIGLAIGVVVIGGSVVGGIALANDRGHDPAPAVTDQPAPTATDDDDSNDANDQNEANEQGEDVDDEATPNATHEAGEDAGDDDAADATDHNGHNPEPSSSGHRDDD
jgi:hypothetical protein